MDGFWLPSWGVLGGVVIFTFWNLFGSWGYLGPRWPQEPSKKPWGPILGPIFIDFLSIFGSFLVDLYAIGPSSRRLDTSLLRAAYRATIARRAPALRAQYGGRACEYKKHAFTRRMYRNLNPV